MGTGGSDTGNPTDLTTTAAWYNYATAVPGSTLSSYASQFSVLIPELTTGNTNITVADLDQGVAQSFIVPTATPEPGTMLMLGSALILLGCVGKRHRKN
jgi:hypothetical protein